MAYIEDEIITLKNEVASASSNINQLRSQVSHVDAQTQSNTNRIINVNQQLNNLQAAIYLRAGSISNEDEDHRQTYITKDQAEALSLMKWLRETMPNRYDVIQMYDRLTIAFDEKSDAVMFKLAWGGSK